MTTTKGMNIKDDRERVLSAIRDWTALFGSPPTTRDWSPAGWRAEPWREERYASTGRAWPRVGTVKRLFGSWGKGLAAAGCKRRRLKDRCKRGHPLSGRNLYLRPNGGRDCRTCALWNGRRSRARRTVAEGGTYPGPKPPSAPPGGTRRRVKFTPAGSAAT